MKNVITLRLEYDPDIECPNDACCEWRYVSFNRRHRHHESIEDYFNEYAEVRGYYPKIEIANKLRVGTAFMVDCYEHGTSHYSLHGEGMQDRWDTSSCSGILLWEHPTSHIGAKTYADRAKDARCFLERYTSWANGEGYWYGIEDPEGDPVDSCGGFYGNDSTYMVQEYISPEIRAYMKGHGFSSAIVTNEKNFDECYVAANPCTLFIKIVGDARDLMCYETLDLAPREAVAA